MYELVLLLRSLFTSPFARVENGPYTPIEPMAPSRSYVEYDPRGLDHAEITDTGPVFQNRPAGGEHVI